MGKQASPGKGARVSLAKSLQSKVNVKKDTGCLKKDVKEENGASAQVIVHDGGWIEFPKVCLCACCHQTSDDIEKDLLPTATPRKVSWRNYKKMKSRGWEESRLCEVRERVRRVLLRSEAA